MIINARKYCCKKMEGWLKHGNWNLDFSRYVYVSIGPKYMTEESLKVDFCPFCGEKIVYESDTSKGGKK